MLNWPGEGGNLFVGQGEEEFGKAHKRKKTMRELVIATRI